MSRALLAVAGACALLAACTPTTVAQDMCTGTPNMRDIVDQQPDLVTKGTNGLKFTVPVNSFTPNLTVLHMYGTPYEMGHAYGSLMKSEMEMLVPEVMKYIYSEIDSYIKFLPASWRAAIEKWGVGMALNITYDLTKPYISPAFTQEVQGVADGAGMQFDDIMHMALFPELIQAACSMYGAWGPATMSSRGGELVQLRALDWSTDGPFQLAPVLLVYHPQASNGHAFTTLTWAGLVGSITGYSSVEMGVCEKVWIHYKGKKPRNGIPFTFLLRDILQYDTTIEEAVARINEANRTCSIFVGVGSNKEQSFRGIEYSHDEVNVYDDKDFPAYPPYHNLSAGLVFFDKHTQPSMNTCFNDLLHDSYGSIDPVVTLRNITSVFQTGDMHIAIYDFKEGDMYISNASPSNFTAGVTTPLVKAYDNTFIKLDVDALFAQTMEDA